MLRELQASALFLPDFPKRPRYTHTENAATSQGGFNRCSSAVSRRTNPTPFDLQPFLCKSKFGERDYAPKSAIVTP